LQNWRNNNNKILWSNRKIYLDKKENIKMIFWKIKIISIAMKIVLFDFFVSFLSVIVAIVLYQIALFNDKTF
jgi:hypothetical protein